MTNEPEPSSRRGLIAILAVGLPAIALGLVSWWYAQSL